MATRRMMSRRVLDSARFLRLPASSRELYFQMIMRADDDGVLEAWPLLRLLGAADGDLSRLEQCGLVRVLNEDLVCWLPDWREHNTIRPDRKVDSIYRALLEQVVPDVELVEPRPRSDASGSRESLDGPAADHGPLRIGKDRVGQDSTDEVMAEQDSPEEIRTVQPSEGEENAASCGRRAAPAHEEKRPFGPYGNVMLSCAELASLKSEFPGDWRARIERLDAYIETKGTQYRSHYAVIRMWAEQDAQGRREGGRSAPVSDGVDPLALAAIRRRMRQSAGEMPDPSLPAGIS